MDLLDRSTAEGTDLGEDLLAELAGLVALAQADGTVDRELHPTESARALLALLVGHRHVRGLPGAGADEDLATLRLVVTRWLHPTRVGRARDSG